MTTKEIHGTTLSERADTNSQLLLLLLLLLLFFHFLLYHQVSIIWIIFVNKWSLIFTGKIDNLLCNHQTSNERTTRIRTDNSKCRISSISFGSKESLKTVTLDT